MSKCVKCNKEILNGTELETEIGHFCLRCFAFYKYDHEIFEKKVCYSCELRKRTHLCSDGFFRCKECILSSLPIKMQPRARVETIHHILDNYEPDFSKLPEYLPEQLERIKEISRRWIAPGKIKGPDNNNVSATISVEENEWEEVIDWMWRNRNYYNGLSLLPKDGGSYKQAPFESCTKEVFLEKSKYLKAIDLKKVLELSDNTELQGELACSGGSCEIF